MYFKYKYKYIMKKYLSSYNNKYKYKYISTY